MNTNDPQAFLEGGKAVMADLPLAMVLTDPNKSDNPIIYVNRAFERVTGYEANHAIGRNCRFLQGDDRDQPAVQTLRDAIAVPESVVVTLTNYRADGTPFLNRLMIAPVQDDNDEIFAFVGIQAEVTPADPDAERTARSFDTQLEEMQHRVKNHLQMVSSMIRLQARDLDPVESYKVLARRVDALALLYDEFSTPPGAQGEMRYDVVSAGGYVSRVAATVGALDGRRNIRIGVDADTVYMRTERAAQLGLLTSELLSNTLQHAFKARSEGLVEVRLKQQGGDRIRLTVSDDGLGMGNANWPQEGNLGAQIVRGLVARLDGVIHVTTGGGGTTVTIEFENALDTSLEADGQRVVTAPYGDRAGHSDEAV
ncbi:MAG: PAS domain-containing protein [Pseudomonadota bacterium]